MKKFVLGVALSVVALFAVVSTASATITTPVGTAGTARGNVRIAGSIITADCALSLSGRVASTTTVSVTSGSGSCNVGGLTLAGFPWTLRFQLSPRLWSVSPIRATVATPLGNCIYSGTLAGTYVAGNPTVLTIVRALSSLTRDPSSIFACTATPDISGSLTVTVATR